MEDGLGEFKDTKSGGSKVVLILVVMEDGFGVVKNFMNKAEVRGLNPCCNGRWFRRYIEYNKSQKNSVLILVVMEDGFGGNMEFLFSKWSDVLILVVMEDGFGE